jgi:hypothetical protein
MKKLAENFDQLKPLSSGIAILEKSAKTELPELQGWNLDETKNYGDSELIFLSKDFSR